jgi:cbb3-type cytochrome oxidase subunit 3
MTMERPEERVAEAWRAQPTGEAEMSASHIRLKAEMFETRTARHMKLARAAFALVLIGNIAEIAIESNRWERIGSGLTILAVVFVVFDALRRRRRDRAEVASGAMDSVRFYRAELVRRRDEYRQFWWRYALPFVPGIALSLFGAAAVPRSPAQYALLAVLFAGFLAGIAFANRRGARQIQAEIDELDG